MGYKFDVFLSYKHGYPFGNWVHEHFLELFRSLVREALNRPLELFIDKEGINSGDTWDARLKNAVVHSRCLVAIWSPSYFWSSWCMHECALMIYRARQLGYGTLSHPTGLILPVVVFDGENFPDFARQIQHFDCRNYARVGPGFRETTRYTEFQDCMNSWSENVAKVINSAPTWRDEWERDEWVNAAINSLPPITKGPQSPINKFGPPVLE